jgi:hypothetical protein
VISEGYQRAKLLSGDELTLLKSLSKLVSDTGSFVESPNARASLKSLIVSRSASIATIYGLRYSRPPICQALHRPPAKAPTGRHSPGRPLRYQRHARRPFHHSSFPRFVYPREPRRSLWSHRQMSVHGGGIRRLGFPPITCRPHRVSPAFILVSSAMIRYCTPEST